jgi:hypothetical protein
VAPRDARTVPPLFGTPGPDEGPPRGAARAGVRGGADGPADDEPDGGDVPF